jgi:hypothetical protein
MRRCDLDSSQISAEVPGCLEYRLDLKVYFETAHAGVIPRLRSAAVTD